MEEFGLDSFGLDPVALLASDPDGGAFASATDSVGGIILLANTDYGKPQPTLVAGGDFPYVNFNGAVLEASDMADLQDVLLPAIGNGFTIFLVVRTSRSGFQTLLSKNVAGSNSTFLTLGAYGVAPNDGIPRIWNDPGNTFGPASVNDGQWHAVMARLLRTGDTNWQIQISVDGAKGAVYNRDFPTANDTVYFTIGQVAGRGPDFRFYGDFARIAVGNSYLTDQQHDQVFASSANLYGTPNNVVIPPPPANPDCWLIYGDSNVQYDSISPRIKARAEQLYGRTITLVKQGHAGKTVAEMTPGSGTGYIEDAVAAAVATGASKVIILSGTNSARIVDNVPAVDVVDDWEAQVAYFRTHVPNIGANGTIMIVPTITPSPEGVTAKAPNGWNQASATLVQAYHTELVARNSDQYDVASLNAYDSIRVAPHIPADGIHPGDDTGTGNLSATLVGTAIANDFFAFDAPVAATPTIMPGTGVVASGQQITITTDTTPSEVRYTTDDTEPTSASPLYTASFTLTNSGNAPVAVRVRARTFAVGHNPSEIASNLYSVSPAAQPDTTAPTVLSCVVNTDGETGTVTFSEPVSGSLSSFTFAVGGQTRSVIFSGSGSTRTFTLASTVYSGQVVTRSYTGSAVIDGAQNPLGAFSNVVVTNNSQQDAPVESGGGGLTTEQSETLDWLRSMIEPVGPSRRYKATALAQAPTAEVEGGMVRYQVEASGVPAEALRLTAGDGGPDLVYSVGAPISDTATVVFEMRRLGATDPAVIGSAVVVDGAMGRVRFAWGVQQVPVPGRYEARFIVDGTSFPLTGAIPVRIG